MTERSKRRVEEEEKEKNKKFWEELITMKTMRPTILLLLRVFVTAVTFLPSRCLATIGGFFLQSTV
jgi:hypothetical protein